MRITKFERLPEGTHRANVSLNGDTVTMTNDYGVWGTPPVNGGYRKEALPFVAAALAAKLPCAERGKR